MKAIQYLSMSVGFVMATQAALADHANHSLAGTQDLLASCKSDAPTLRAMCLGYLAAMSDEVLREQAGAGARQTLCAPEIVDLDAYRRAFIAFAEKAPVVLEGHSYEAVKAALRARWPCPG